MEATSSIVEQNMMGLSLIIGIGVVSTFIYCLVFAPKKRVEGTEKEEATKGAKAKEIPEKSKPHSQKPKEKSPQNPSLLNVIKGHTDDITWASFSPNGKILVSVSKDRTMRVAVIETLTDVPKVVRINLPFDHATAACWSSDSHYLLLALSSGDILAYRFLEKKIEGKSYKEVYRFPAGHAGPITSVSLSADSKHVLTSTEDTILKLWTPKGKLLHEINTSQVKTNMSCLSPDSKFMCAATWTGDVRIWEIHYSKSDASVFEKVTKAMELKGHKSTVYCVGFSSDSKYVATTSKDLTFKLWRINVRYHLGEDPECVLTCPSPSKTPFQLVAFAPSGSLLALTMKNAIYLYDLKGNLLQTFEHAHEGDILSLSWSPSSSSLSSCDVNSTKIWKISTPNQ